MNYKRTLSLVISLMMVFSAMTSGFAVAWDSTQATGENTGESSAVDNTEGGAAGENQDTGGAGEGTETGSGESSGTETGENTGEGTGDNAGSEGQSGTGGETGDASGTENAEEGSNSGGTSSENTGAESEQGQKPEESGNTVPGAEGNPAAEGEASPEDGATNDGAVGEDQNAEDTEAAEEPPIIDEDPDAEPEEDPNNGSTDAYVPLEVYFNPEIGTTLLYPLSRKGIITTQFGAFDDLHPNGHKGLDIAADTGTPIMAAEAGTVTKAEYYGGYGNVVFIDHGNGLQTRYAHMSEINVKAGDVVKRGQQIGKVGSTGRSTGPHLHFEVIFNGQFVNPILYIEERCLAGAQEATVNGVKVTVNAEAGAFPEGWQLSVKDVSILEKIKIEYAIHKMHETASKAAKTYTFDIKILDAAGNEVEPAAGRSVKVSFEAEDLKGDNLSANVYHVHESSLSGVPVSQVVPEALETEISGNTATVETDGFSYYTVEFTYEGMQYVLEGDGVVKLADLLKSIGIEGEVKGTAVSDPTLFNVILGTESGVKYVKVFANGGTRKVPVNNPDGKVRYVASYQPFTTEEWLDVTMTDGTTYHIIVTDAITGNGTNNDPIDGVSQGVGENFAETIPVADIWIDEQIINKTVQARMVGDHDTWELKWVPGELMDPSSDKYDKGFQVDDSGDETTKGAAQYYGNHFIIYNTNTSDEEGGKALDGSIETTLNDETTPAVQSYNYFEGEVGTYIWTNAAIQANPDGTEELLDVWITYSNPIITLETETNATEAPSWTGVKVGLFGPNVMTNGKDVNNGKRYALDIEVTPTVRRKDGSIVGGYFYYPMVHINVDRTTNANNGNPLVGFQKFYKGNPDLENYDERMHSYSEQVWIKDGLVANQSGDVIHIPGGSGDQMNYIPNILEEDGAYIVYPSPRNNDLAKNGDPVVLPDGTEVKPGDSFYFGFLTLVNNGEFKLGYNSSSGADKSGMETYILSGTPFNYRLRHSTETLPSDTNPNPDPMDGGMIQTTRYGNHNGLLNEGERINPSIIATASGQTVVYTFFPNPGYGIRELWVWNDPSTADHSFPTTADMKNGAATKIRLGDGTNNTFVAHDDNNDGIPDRYTYEFNAIHADNAIHVVWGQTILEVTKNTTGTGGNDPDTFQFRIKAWKEDPYSAIDFTNSYDPVMNARFTKMEDGWYSFELTNGETLSVPPELIPLGYKWTVEEIGYKVGNKTQWGKTYDDWNLTSAQTITSEFITKETQYVDFTNSRKKPITGEKLTVKKIWKDDEKSIRPKNITMTIEKPGAIGINAQDFGQAIRDLGNAKTVEKIEYGTAVEYNNAKSTGKTIKSVDSVSGRGEGTVYFWRDGNDVYFYSESDIYLLGSAYALFGDDDSSNDNKNFAALSDISGLEFVHTDFVTNMANMFLNCYSLKDLSPLQNWNTANVTNMAKMFGAANPNQAGKAMTYSSVKDLRNWQTQNVTNMRWMFKGAKALSDLTPLSGWDTGRVERMEQMFFRTSAGVITNKQALENWNVQSVIKSPDNRFSQMFGNSVNQGQAKPVPEDLPNWTTAAKPREGSWNDSGTYNPNKGPEDKPAEYGKNDEAAFFANPHKDQKSSKAHDVDESDPTGNTWIYEFEIPAGTTWDVYETLPANVDGFYEVSTSYDNGKTEPDKETSGPHDGVGKKGEPFKSAQSGSITTITNTGKKHELIIKKDIPDNEDISQLDDKDKTFTFKLTFKLGGKPYDIDGTTQYQELHDAGSIEKKSAGVYELKLIGRTSEEFILPAGVEYEVEEIDSDGWSLIGSNHTYGTMNQDREASFINSMSDTVNVLKKWEGDRYNGAVFPTRPTKLDALGIKITTEDTMTRWKTAGAEKHVYSGDSYFSDIRDKYNEQNLDPEVMAADGETPYTPTMEHPKYVKLDAAIGPFATGDYVIDKVNETHYRVMPVTNVPVTKTYTDLAFGEEWDEDDEWLYEYDIPATEKVTKVEETTVPKYYQKVEPTIDDSGKTTFEITNTLETRNLKIEKETVDDEPGEFEFGIRFWVENSTKERHPVKIGHSQIITKDNAGEEIVEAEFTFENGITIDGKDVAGVFELIDGEISGQNLHSNGTKPTMDQLDAIISALRTIEEGSPDDDFKQHKETNKTLKDFGLKWNGQDTEVVYVDQDSTVVENLFTNGRRMDWYIIPTPGHDEVISIRTPYGLREEANSDGPKQLPEGVTGNEDTGTYHFKLQNGAHITFPKLPAGVSYDIVEFKYHDWDLKSTEGEVKGQLLDEGDTRTVKFINEKRKGAVKISKKTEYNEAGNFMFRIKAWEGEGDDAKYMDFSSQGAKKVVGVDGVYEFSLENGKNITFKDIPYGYSYEIEEQTKEGWELISLDNDTDGDKIAEGIVNSEKTVSYTFTNKGPGVPPTAGEDETYSLKGRTQKGKPEFKQGTAPFEKFMLIDPKSGEEVTSITIPGQGKYTIDTKTGEVTFVPEKDFVGTATKVTIRATDTYGNTAEGYYTPHIVDPEEKEEVKRIIKFSYEKKDGTPVTDSITQTGTITRKALEVDPKTGKVTKWGPWTSYTFPAVKNPDEEAGPEWATKDIAGEYTVNGPQEDDIPIEYIVYHKTDDPVDPEPTPTPDEPEKPTPPKSAETGDETNIALWAGMFSMVSLALAVLLGIKRRKILSERK